MRRPLAALLLALLAACSVSVRTSRSAAEETAQIEELGRRFSAAYVRGDVEEMLSIYTPDAVIFPVNSEMLRGTDALRRYWRLGEGERITLHRATPTEIRIDGDHAYDYGVYEIAGVSNGQAWGPSHGKYVIVWRRTEQGWRMHLDIWNPRPRQ